MFFFAGLRDSIQKLQACCSDASEMLNKIGESLVSTSIPAIPLLSGPQLPTPAQMPVPQISASAGPSSSSTGQLQVLNSVPSIPSGAVPPMQRAAEQTLVNGSSLVALPSGGVLLDPSPLPFMPPFVQPGPPTTFEQSYGSLTSNASDRGNSDVDDIISTLLSDDYICCSTSEVVDNTVHVLPQETGRLFVNFTSEHQSGG